MTFEASANMGDLAGMGGMMAKAAGITSLVSLAITILFLIAQAKIYKKAGRPGIAVIVPIWNMWTLFDIVYGNGARLFLLLIPFYNFYVLIKLSIDLAHAYGKPTGFGIGLIVFAPLWLVLGFGKAEYTGTASKPTKEVRKKPVKEAPKDPDDIMSAVRIVKR